MHPSTETRKLDCCCVCWVLGGLWITPWITPKPRQVRFKLGGWLIVQRRVQSLVIVDIFNERADPLTRVVEIAIISPVYLLLLECFHEALSFRIVVWIPDPAHAWLNIMCGEHLSIVAACVLYTAIGVMDQSSRCRTARFDSHLDRYERKARS